MDTTCIIIMAWIICGLIAAYIYRQRDRSYTVGLLGGLLLGPLGIILALVTPADTRRCPHCAEPINKAAIVCKHCGHNVQPARSDSHLPLTDQ